MRADPRAFGDLLSKAIRLIAAREDKSIAVVQDELVYALGRSGGTAVEYWRKGHIPPTVEVALTLLVELRRRAELGPSEMERLARSAGLALTEIPEPHTQRDDPVETATRSPSVAPTHPESRLACGLADSSFCRNGWCLSAGVCRLPDGAQP